jgi:hypothetical protein
MKTHKKLLLLSIFTTTLTWAQTFKSPDIVIDSKLDYDWSQVLVTKFRTLIKNYNMTDPFSGNFPGNITLNESKLGSLLPEESKGLIRDFGNVIGLHFLETDTKVVMKDFRYDVKGFKTDIQANEKLLDGLSIGTNFSASEITLNAEKLTLSLIVPGVNHSPVFNVDVIKPSIKASEEKLINFFAQIKITDYKDHFKLQILKANFDKMSDRLMANTKDLALDYEKIIVPKVSVKIGSKTVNFSPDKIQKLIRDNHQAIKGLLLSQAADILRSNTTAAAFKVLEQYKLNKEYWIATSALESQFKIENFGTSGEGDNIEVNMPGDFCTIEKFGLHKKECVTKKVTQIAPTRLTSRIHQESILEMKSLMTDGDANIVASISEDYVNKLLVTTYDAGLWKESLDEAGVELGPNKVIMRLDKKGDSGTLIMDVVYRPTKMEKFLTGSKVIRFPLVLDVSLRIEKNEDEPIVIIRLKDVDTSDETIINGKPELNMMSTVKDVPRFKGKVANAIREKVSVLRNKDIIELRYPEFKGLGLDKVDFLSDGLGRMNAIMRLEDLIEEGNGV